MKEMQYKAERINEVLDNGTINGFNYIIMSYGYHPCAYVELPEGHSWLDDNNIEVHGGITFSDIRDFGFGMHYYIGWDYAHWDDYSGMDMMMPNEYKMGGKKWTTEEILEDVKYVIEQLKEQRQEYEVED